MTDMTDHDIEQLDLRENLGAPRPDARGSRSQAAGNQVALVVICSGMTVDAAMFAAGAFFVKLLEH